MDSLWKKYQGKSDSKDVVHAIKLDGFAEDPAIRRWLDDIVYYFADVYDLDVNVTVKFNFEGRLFSLYSGDIIIKYSTGGRNMMPKSIFDHFYEEVIEENKVEDQEK